MRSRLLASRNLYLRGKSCYLAVISFLEYPTKSKMVLYDINFLDSVNKSTWLLGALIASCYRYIASKFIACTITAWSGGVQPTLYFGLTLNKITASAYKLKLCVIHSCYDIYLAVSTKIFQSRRLIPGRLL